MRKIAEIIDEAYDIFVMSYEKFEKDNRWQGGFKPEYVCTVAEISEKMLVNERISAESKTRQTSTSDIITVILKDGKEKTIAVKDHIRAEKFHYDTKNYCWRKKMKKSSWDYLKNKYPFDSLTAEVVEGN